MNDLIAELDLRLSALAPELTAEYLAERESLMPAPEQAAPAARARRRRSGRIATRPRVAFGGFLALELIVVAALSLRAGPGATLPLERTPFSAAPAQAADAPSVRNLELSRAHAFAVPGNAKPGYLIPDKTHATLCLVVPDVGTSFGGTCAGRENVLRNGISAVLAKGAWTEPGPDPLIVVVLPLGTTAVLLHQGQTVTTPAITDGVVAIRVTRNSTLTWDGAAGPQHVTARLPQVSISYFGCQDGKEFRLPNTRLPAGRLGVNALWKRLCAPHGGVDYKLPPPSTTPQATPTP